ncbi:bile acid:sodium symporter family protein [bacterium]|nr:bile acid:sodium symporter family protein [bacterium]
MDLLNKFFGKHMSAIILLASVVALVYPPSFLWVKTGWINYLLMLIMFGMGMTLKPEAFLFVFKRPLDILTGTLAQFIIMPLLAYAISKGFRLEAGLMAGMILVGACPGGTASNVITYLAKGDVALSVAMTSVNTLLAPLLTPLITYMLLKATVQVDVCAMFFSIIKVVIIPIALGLTLNKFFEKACEKMTNFLPVFSIICITLTVASVISHNAEEIRRTGAIILIAVMAHNLLGFLIGYLLGLVLKMAPQKRRTLSIEVGMQNSGLAVSLAKTSFPDLAMATVPGAIFSVWHNLSGAFLASVFRRLESKQDS